MSTSQLHVVKATGPEIMSSPLGLSVPPFPPHTMETMRVQTPESWCKDSTRWYVSSAQSSAWNSESASCMFGIISIFRNK